MSNPDCVPVMLPTNDPFYTKFGIRCMVVTRSTAVQNPSGSAFREQINTNEAFISGSAIYGSTQNDANRLRTFRDGKLFTSPSPNPKTALLPESPDQCGVVRCFLSGDKRASLTPEIGSLMTLLVRHHNHLADELKAINRGWTDERIYQEARRIIGAIIQLVTYRNYLPLLLGPKNMKGFELELVNSGYYNGYDPTINPTTSNEFGAAAYRFGHSSLIASYESFDASHRLMPSPPFSQTILNPEELYQHKLDVIVRGLMEQNMGEVDQFFTAEITDHLFETLGKPGSGQDLFAINLQRGRDHGLAGYNKWREFCSLSKMTSFDDLTRVMPVNVAHTMKKLYKSVDDIDLYAAGVSEYHIQGGIVGPTFACIIGNQFRNLRRGDRFWFENGNHIGAFTQDQLADVKKMTLKDIICANSASITQVSKNPFLVSSKNSMINCATVKLPLLNPQSWLDKANRSG